MRHLDYILITRAGDGRWPRYQAKSLACPGCDGRTPLIRAPIGLYAKVRLFKARFEGEAAIF